MGENNEKAAGWARAVAQSDIDGSLKAPMGEAVFRMASLVFKAKHGDGVVLSHAVDEFLQAYSEMGMTGRDVLTAFLKDLLGQPPRELYLQLRKLDQIKIPTIL